MPRTLKPIQFFRPGTFTAMSGRVIAFTEAMLRDAAATYDPKVYQAPLVAGHPKTEDPNYGLVERLDFAEDGFLYAIPEHVEEAFAELVATKRFNTVSGSWYLPDHASNPKPGHLYLKHLGFLGAVPPALKGLKRPEASFAEEEDGCVTCFAELDDGGTLSTLTVQPPDPEPIPSPSFSEGPQGVSMEPKTQGAPAPGAGEPAPAPPSPTPEAFAEQQKALHDKQAELDAASAKLAEREKKLRRSEIASFADDLITSGKLLPAEKVGLVEFALGLDEGHTVEFSEGEGDAATPVKKSALAFLQDFFRNRPAVVSFGEHAKPDQQPKPGAAFVAPPGATVDPTHQELADKAAAFAEEHGVSFADALSALSIPQGGA